MNHQITEPQPSVETKCQPEGSPSHERPRHPWFARRRTGTVARLPGVVRDQLNLMLRDGLPYAKIIESLGEPARDLNPDILSRWHHGGFRDWLQQQTWLEELRLQLEFASDVVSSKNVNLLNEAGLRIALARMFSLLTTFDPASLSDKMQLQPGTYPRLINALCNLANGALKYERHRAQQGLRPNPSLARAHRTHPNPTPEAPSAAIRADPRLSTAIRG